MTERGVLGALRRLSKFSGARMTERGVLGALRRLSRISDGSP